MAEKKAAGKGSPAKRAKKSASPKKAAAAGPSGDKAAGAAAVLANLAAMPEADRAMGKRVHEIVLASAPDLTPRLWYGMPAYARADGKVICFFQSAAKFKSRYATFGFLHDARLDDGGLWPVAFALKELTASAEARIAELVTKALG